MGRRMNREALERRAHSVAELRRMARRRLPRVVFDFVDGGAEDETTLDDNEVAFKELAFWPKPLNGASAPDLSTMLFGEKLSLPVIIGPTGLSGMLWPRGEAEAARAAAKAGTVWCMSHGSTITIEDLAREVPGPKWFQVFMYRDRGLTRAFAERAQAAGYKALVLTSDNQLLGQRERDLRNGFTIPPRVRLRQGLALLSALPWLLRMARTPGMTFANYVTDEKKDILSLGKHMAELLDPAACWRDVSWLRDIWRGPLLIKGVLHPDEARAAIDHGVDGVIVSNHGGRQLDGAIASVRALPAVVEAAAGRIPVLIDGGVRRGADVVKALALGASACLIGRPHLWGLAVAGEEGVAWTLEIYRREIERVLALGGWEGVAALDRGILEPMKSVEKPVTAIPRRAPAGLTV
jgi:isopentenyl diphosphate isomerase/L-lactate dehydrogenase-like FMN-dependent dehydrogenase